MAPFEALYDRKCRTPLNWIEPSERRFYGIDFVKEVIEPASVKIQSDLTYEERPIRVLEIMERVTSSKVIKFYKWYGITMVSKTLRGSERIIFVRSIRFSTRDG